MPELKYFNPITFENITYSVDMLKLNLNFHYGLNQDFCSWFSRQLNLDYKHYTTVALYRYRDFFSVTLRNGESFTFSIGFNDLARVDYQKGMIRFNPNKCCNDSDFCYFLNYLNYSCKEILINQWDMAIDLPYSRKMVKLHKDNRTYTRIEHGSLSEYLGTGSNNGRVKLYDKTKESKLKYELTRLELTIDGQPYFDDVKKLLPKIDIFVSQLDIDSVLELSQNDLVFLRLLLSSPDFDLYYNQLTYRARQKFAPYIFNRSNSFEFSRKAYYHLLEVLSGFMKVRHLK